MNESKSHEPTNSDREQDSYRRLAEYLAASFVSFRMGVTFATAKRRVAEERLGPFWFNLAKLIDEEMAIELDRRKLESPRTIPSGIQ